MGQKANLYFHVQQVEVATCHFKPKKPTGILYDGLYYIMFNTQY